MPKGFFLERLTWPKAKAAFAKTSVVVVPIGSTEQHGPHLPLGTDFLIAQELARRVGQRANVIVTPTISIGYAKYHTVFPGTLSLGEETLSHGLVEICQDLLKYGTSHILFVDGHGGNLTALRQCGEWLRERCVPSAVACWWEMTHVVNPKWMAIGHADYIETSMMLALDESLVDLAAAHLPVNKPLTPKIALDNVRLARFKGGHLGVNCIMTDISDTGDMMEFGLTAAQGYDTPPSAGTKEIGEAIFEGLADYLAEFVVEFRKVRLPAVGSTGPLAK